MSRTREFSADKAVAGAMEIFWRQGFKATNLPDLLHAMGLTRGSFYKAFRDKENVYLSALDMYNDTVISNTVVMLADCSGHSAHACLLQLFSNSADKKRGCFLCNAIVELGPDNVKVADRANAMTSRLRAAIFDVLERFGVPAASEKADLVLHLYFGYQALGKSGASDVDWANMLEGILGT